MSMRSVLQDSLIGLASGYAGVKAMSPVTTKMMEMESKQDKEREDRVSPGVAYNIAAKDLAGRVGIQLDDKKAKQGGNLFHLGLGLAAGEMYVALRRETSLNPLLASLAVGLSLYLGIDEGITPAMGWSAPATAYPLATHLRGLVGHLTLGITVGVVAELLSWVMKRG